MNATYAIRAEMIPDGEGCYGVRAVCDITFHQDDGTSIVGTSITSPGVWEVGGQRDDPVFESYADEELDTLRNMLYALGVTFNRVADEWPDDGAAALARSTTVA